VRSFMERYLDFCRLNDLDAQDRRSLLLAIAQARRHGLAASSLDTYVDGLLHHLPMKGKWAIKAIVRCAHAEAVPVQPRAIAWDEKGLLTWVHQTENIPDAVLLWLLLATGARPIDIFRLSFRLILLEKDRVRIAWWLRKAQRRRHQRHEEEYLFAWSAPPSKQVEKYLKEGPPEHGVLPITKCFSQRTVSSHVSDLIKKKFPELTSYVFRDRMVQKLAELQTSPAMVKRLLDHTAETETASYTKGKIASSIVKEVRAKRGREE
jgi:hypothetical protein